MKLKSKFMYGAHVVEHNGSTVWNMRPFVLFV